MVRLQKQNCRYSLTPACRVVFGAMAVVAVSAMALGAGTARADHHPDHRGAGTGQWYFTGGAETLLRVSGSGALGDAPAFSLDRGEPGGVLALPFDSGTGSDRRAFSFTLADDESVGRVEFTVGQPGSAEDDGAAYTLVMKRSFDGDSTAITPHLMAGLGMAYTKDDNTAAFDADSDASTSAPGSWKPTIQVGLGASYEVTPSWEVLARVRAFVMGTEELAIDRDLAIGSQDYKISQDFMIGTRLRF